MRGLKAILVVGAIMVAGSAFGQCRDPWVTKNVNDYLKANKGRTVLGKGDTAECNYVLYGSNWNSEAQLKSQIMATFNALREAGLEYASENTMRDLKYFTTVYANAGNAYVGPAGGAPAAWRDQTQTAGGTYWWHVPLPNNHVLVVARKCRRGYSSAGPGANSGCVR